MEDRRIVELYWSRSESAISETDKKYGRYIYNIANNILSDDEDSKECVNDTYMRAWNTMPSNRPDKLSVYLFKIVRGIAIDFYRKKNADKRISSQYSLSLSELGECISGKDTAVSSAEYELLYSLINRFVLALSNTERTVFISRYYFMDSINDIAKNLGFSVPKVKNMLFRTRNKLKNFIESEGFPI